MYFKRVVKGMSLSFLLILVGSLLAYLLRRSFAVNLSVEEYGLLYSMIAFFSFFMLFIDFGLEQATTKKIVELIEENKKEWKKEEKEEEIRKTVATIFLFQMSCSLFLFGIFFLAKDLIATYYFHNPHAASFFWILGIWFLTTPIITAVAYILLGFQRTTAYTAIDAMRSGFLLLFCTFFFFFFWKEPSLYSVVLGYAIVNILITIPLLPYITSFFPKLWKQSFFQEFQKNTWKEIISYGSILALTNFGWILMTQTDTLLLTYMKGQYAVGLYNVALPISLLLLFFMRPVIIVFAPLMTAFVAQKKKEKIEEALVMAYKYLYILLIPCVVGIVLFPSQGITLLFDEKYANAAATLIILSIGTVFYAFSLLNNIVFTSMGEAKKMAMRVAAIAGVNLVLNVLFIPIWGITGAALATAVSYVLLFIISTRKIREYVPLVFPWKTWLGSSAAAGVAGLVVWLIQTQIKFSLWESMWGKVISGGIFLSIAYILLLYLFQVVRKEDIQELMKKYNRVR